MKLVNNLCEKLGITHYDLSVMIGASRSTVTKVAASERNLPVPFLLELSALQNIVNSLPEPAGPANEINYKYFRLLVQEHEYKLALFERELSETRTRYKQSALLLLLIDKLLEKPHTAKQDNWYQLLKSKAEKCQLKCGLQRQAELIASIKITEKAIIVYNGYASPV